MIWKATVDGRNPAPADRWFIPLFIWFEPSKVVQGCFHPQYDQFLCPLAFYPRLGQLIFPRPPDTTAQDWSVFVARAMSRMVPGYKIMITDELAANRIPFFVASLKHGSFLSHGGTPSLSSILSSDFQWNKPSISPRNVSSNPTRNWTPSSSEPESLRSHFISWLSWHLTRFRSWLETSPF